MWWLCGNDHWQEWPNFQERPIPCGERACPRLSAQRSQDSRGRCAAQRGQAPSPQGGGGVANWVVALRE
ncbi:hypothetical protein C9I50_01715 [Pseudomonas prosekii]|nr:hypothetical protein C9I50_01715 [Pseudomonas prosekii]